MQRCMQIKNRYSNNHHEKSYPILYLCYTFYYIWLRKLFLWVYDNYKKCKCAFIDLFVWFRHIRIRACNVSEMLDTLHKSISVSNLKKYVCSFWLYCCKVSHDRALRSHWSCLMLNDTIWNILPLGQKGIFSAVLWSFTASCPNPCQSSWWAVCLKQHPAWGWADWLV